MQFSLFGLINTMFFIYAIDDVQFCAWKFLSTSKSQGIIQSRYVGGS